MIVITNLIYKMIQEECFTNALILKKNHFFFDDIYYNGAIKTHIKTFILLSAFQRTATKSTECYYHPLIFQND